MRGVIYKSVHLPDTFQARKHREVFIEWLVVVSSCFFNPICNCICCCIVIVLQNKPLVMVCILFLSFNHLHITSLPVSFDSIGHFYNVTQWKGQDNIMFNMTGRIIPSGDSSSLSTYQYRFMRTALFLHYFLRGETGNKSSISWINLLCNILNIRLTAIVYLA